MSRFRVGIDIGGTFTDFVVHDTSTNVLASIKVPTVPGEPVQGVTAGLDTLRDEHGIDPAQVGYFVHGATIAVNALIERKGARLALLTTRGFRDMLLIQRLRIPQPHYWYGSRPAPLVPRERVCEIDERLRADGSVEQAPSEESLRAALARVKAQEVDGVVICFLHAFRNPAHERIAREFLAREAPELFVCCSHEVWPQMREYERAIVTLVNAYVTPPVNRYISVLEDRLAERGIPATPYITRSNGGIMTARRARTSTAETLLSGPASGVIGALRVARQAGIADFITLDVGGTSADVAIVQDGTPQVSVTEHVAEFPMIMPAIGVSCIGAGGGSIAWLDSAGVLKVGPQSAGAHPGPACYGHGQPHPTVTDAFLVGGFLNPSTFAGGRIRLDTGKALAAMETIGPRLGRNASAVAEGIVSVAVAGMYAELSNLAAKRGVDVREFTLVAFGGAGSLLACRVADEIGVRSVLIPQSPGTLCALGALSADVASDFVKSVFLHPGSDGAPLAQAFAELREEAMAWIAAEAPFVQDYKLTLSADMRYHGQSYEINVPLKQEWVEHGDLPATARAFHETHEKMYSHSQPSLAVELIDLRLHISAEMPKPPLPVPRGVHPGTAAKAVASRPIYYAGAVIDAPVYARDQLAAGHAFAGPALVDQSDTTVFVPPSWSGAVHESGSLLVQREN